MTTAAAVPDGVLAVLKPPGMTSHDVVSLCRRVLGTRTVGHAGTLDPAAAGVLPVLVGQSTRLAEYLAWPAKRYRAEILFGLQSDTGDLTGAVEVAVGQLPPEPPSYDRLDAAVAGLVGTRVQVPSAYSARKVDGRKLYQLARAGDVPDDVLSRAAREITVYTAGLVEQRCCAWGPYGPFPAAVVDLTCSSGTYVRELAIALGDTLGLPACLGFLLRQECGGLALNDCVTMEQLTAPSNLALSRRFAPGWRTPAEAVSFLPAWLASGSGAASISHGRAVQLTELTALDVDKAAYRVGGGVAATLASEAAGWARALAPGGGLIAVGRSEREGPGAAGAMMFRPRKVFGR